MAECMAILVDQGKVRFDDTIKTHLKDFQLYDKYVENNLTIRDILCHRSGLPRHDFVWYNNPHYSTKKLLDNLKELQPFTTFRDKYCYQNMMIALGGYIIEKITGRHWTEFLKEQITDKIGIKDICFSVEALEKHKSATGYTYNYETRYYTPLPYKNIDQVSAAGCINSTTSEMIKWIDLQLQCGKHDKRSIIQEVSINECHHPQIIIDTRNDSFVFPGQEWKNYGLCWFVEGYKGKRIIQHAGGIDGFSAMHFFLPGMRFGASILTNVNGSQAVFAMMYALIDLFFEDEETSWPNYIAELVENTYTTSQESSTNLIQRMSRTILPALIPESYVGAYTHPAYGEVEVFLDNDILAAKHGILSIKLEHHSQNDFWGIIVDTDLQIIRAPIQFIVDFNGESIACDIPLEPMLNDPIRFTKQISLEVK
jgi:CubicO group peptidase (beta-lactamase class C family)